MDSCEKILTEKLGENLHYFEEVDSTNTFAKEMSEWDNGTVIIANAQTAGRGTYGRKFHSRAGSGIYMTMMINTDLWHFKNEKLATIYTAVAVSEAIAKVTKISPAVKWVNDLFVNSKKIGGILTGKDFNSDKLIIGIGINLSGKQQDFPDEIKNIAASLKLDPPLDDQAAAIVLEIYEKMLKEGSLSDEDIILKLYREKLFIMGKVVDIRYNSDVFEALVVAVDHKGRLVVLRNGEKLSLSAGEVMVKA